jgi:hypothetical protein
VTTEHRAAETVLGSTLALAALVIGAKYLTSKPTSGKAKTR